MAIRPKGSGWQVDVTWKGQRAPRVSCATMGEAKRVEAQYLAGLIAGKAPQPASGPARVAGYKSDVGTGAPHGLHRTEPLEGHEGPVLERAQRPPLLRASGLRLPGGLDHCRGDQQHG